MRVPVVAANWKCNTRLESAIALARGLRDSIDGVAGVEKVVCPPFVYLAAVGEVLRDSSLRLGSQDVHWQDDVAATGETGPQMVGELAQYAIIGHSERRHQFGETDEMVNRKVMAVSTPKGTGSLVKSRGKVMWSITSPKLTNTRVLRPWPPMKPSITCWPGSLGLYREQSGAFNNGIDMGPGHR